MTDTECACGSPAKANWYVEIIYGTDAETDYEYGYFCAEHKALPSQLKAPGRRNWKIFEKRVKRLR